MVRQWLAARSPSRFFCLRRFVRVGQAVANALAIQVEETLRPVIGSVLATVSVEVESKRIGKTPDTLEHSDLNRMAQNLVSALNLVVGRELAEAAASKVRELS